MPTNDKLTTHREARATKQGASKAAGRAATARNAAAKASKRGSVTFRPTSEERRILDRLSDEGVTASDAVRRGLRLLEHERWLDRARAEMAANRDENLNDEPDAW